MSGRNAQPRGAAGAETVDARLVALLRCVLAAAALVFFVFRIDEPAQRATYALLVGYCIYSLLLLCATLAAVAVPRLASLHWIDVVVYGALGLLSGRASGMFLLLFFFPIVVASFSRGPAEGGAVSAVSAALAAITAIAVDPLNHWRALAPPAELLLIGCIIAYWGGRQLRHRRRVELLRDVASLVNPRLGLDHAISHSLRRLREFFETDDCILVCPRGASREYVMYHVSASVPQARPPRTLTEESRQTLLALDPQAVLSWRRGRRTRGASADERLQRLANLLDTRCFATVPFRQREGLEGRLYLTGKRCELAAAELQFLREVAAQIAAAVDNLALIEQVMENAAQLERARISRDIHDTTLQPYIGLKLGLEALARKLPPTSPVGEQLAELLDMSTQVIADLRGYVARLRGDDAAWPGEHLLSGLREHVGRYRSFYGIDVELRSDASMRVTDRVAGEAYQIVCEALSNIHRHTPSKKAYVELRCQDEHLAIEVGNESSPALAHEFLPRSIAERAAALGGRAEVHLQRHGHDVVRVAIPL